MFVRMGCVTVRALCLVMMVMVTMGDQERVDNLTRRRLTTRTRQRHDTQVRIGEKCREILYQ